MDAGVIARAAVAAASAIALFFGGVTDASAQLVVDVDRSWSGTVTWDTVVDEGTGITTRQTGNAQFKGTGELTQNFDIWEIDVDWTETYTLTDDGSLSGEPCSATATGAGSSPRAGWIEFGLGWPALQLLNVRLDPDGDTYPVQGDCYPPGTTFVSARAMYSEPAIPLPDGRATTTLAGEASEADGDTSSTWTWLLTRKPDADCDGIPDESDGSTGRLCNFTKAHIDPIERTRRKLHIEGYIDPHYGPDREMTVALFRKRGSSFRKIATRHPVVGATLAWKTVFSRPDPGRCRVKARFPGSRVAEPSQVAKAFDC